MFKKITIYLGIKQLFRNDLSANIFVNVPGICRKPYSTAFSAGTGHRG